MGTTTNQGWEKDDLDQYRKDPDKLYEILQDWRTQLRHERDLDEKRQRDSGVTGLDTTPDIEQSHPTEPSVAVWPGRIWVPAEVDYPISSDVISESSSSSSRSIDVLVYNCTKNELIVRSNIGELSNKRALFSHIPSRWCSKLSVCIERFTPPDARTTPRYRITDKAVPKEFTLRHTISFSQLNQIARLKLMLGRIKWIFVLNVSREFSNSSKRSAIYSDWS
ncbi:hypothetical protein HD806DRAFT_505980 [Xylariaceae sp. AK1471]|nr:hypothetical protein HD806DRAFT_505980 [Xylariaceae sp. AK1471]